MQLQVFPAWTEIPGTEQYGGLLALVNPVGIKVAGYDDAADARWFTLSDMPSLAFDHEHVLLVALHRLALKVYLQLNGIEELDEHFKGFDLKRLQDLILDKYRIHG